LRGGSASTSGDTPRANRPIREATGVRALVFGRGFPVMRSLEERTGLATNLRVLARPV